MKKNRANSIKFLLHVLIINIGYFSILYLTTLLNADHNYYPGGLSKINCQIIIKLIIILYLGLSCWLLQLNNLLRHYFSSYQNLHSIKPISATLLIFLLLRSHEYYEDSIPLLLVFKSAIYDLLVGLNEEILTKGVIFSLLLLYFRPGKGYLLKSVFLTSIMFSLFHFINLVAQPDNLDGITSQVIVAFVVSVYLFGIFLSTKNLFLVSLFHGLINTAFGGVKGLPEAEETATEIMSGSDSGSFFHTLIWLLLLAIILFFGIRMFLKYRDGFDKFLGEELDKA